MVAGLVAFPSSADEPSRSAPVVPEAASLPYASFAALIIVSLPTLVASDSALRCILMQQRSALLHGAAPKTGDWSWVATNQQKFKNVAPIAKSRAWRTRQHKN